MSLEISKGSRGTLEDCERILRSLPEWFGNEQSTLNYLNGINITDTFFAVESNKVIGFISIKLHFELTAELYVLGVLPDYHRKGIGAVLFSSVQSYLKSKNIKMITVKTLGFSHSDKGYADTREYYLSLGFIPLEEFQELWGGGNPCLFMAKSI